MPDNSQRAGWANSAVEAFMLKTGTDRCDAIGDLIGDLMHLADSDGINPLEPVRNGMLHYYAETHHERRPSRFSVEME